MSLCSYHCEICPVHVTIRIDYQENKYKGDAISGILAHRAILDLYERLLENVPVNDDDIAVVLNVSGADVALSCSHLAHKASSPAIELF